MRFCYGQMIVVTLLLLIDVVKLRNLKGIFLSGEGYFCFEKFFSWSPITN